MLSSEEIRRVLDVEADKQALACDTDACLAELGAALGASRVLHGSVARLGSTYVMTLALIDPNEARALGRSTTRAESAERLYDAVPSAVAELLAKTKAKTEPARGPPVLTVTGATVSIASAVVAAASGITLYYLYDQTQDPSGDAAVKQAYLDYNVPLAASALVACGTLVIGAGMLGFGLLVD